MYKPTVQHHYGAYLVGRDLYQTDWDYPRAAERCGWQLCRVQLRGGILTELARVNRSRLLSGADCRHSGTDGTVDCRECGITASEFIQAAGDYLDSLAI